MYRNLLCHLYTIYINDFFSLSPSSSRQRTNYLNRAGEVVEHTRILIVYKVNSRKLLARRDGYSRFSWATIDIL